MSLFHWSDKAFEVEAEKCYFKLTPITALVSQTSTHFFLLADMRKAVLCAFVSQSKKSLKHVIL